MFGKHKTKAAYFAEKFGGKWFYDGHCGWDCDDNQRRITRCSAGVDQFDNEVGPPVYYLYEPGKPGERVF